MDQLSILGSPGTGKTTYIEKLLKDRKDYLYLTYSRSMASSAKKRIQADEGKVGTLHSILAKILGMHSWVTFQDIIEFCKQEKLTYPQRWTVEDATGEADDDWSQFISAYDRSVNTKTGIGYHERLNLPRLKAAYERFKAERGKADYTDILLQASQGDLPYVDTLVVDEAQDLTSLMHNIIDRWPAGNKIYAGDPDQNIFSFRGTSATEFIEVMERGEIMELPHSYRFGDNVRLLGERIMSPVNNRIPKHYTGLGNTEIFQAKLFTFLQLPGQKAILTRTNRLARHVATMVDVPALPLNRGHPLKNGWTDRSIALTNLLHSYPDLKTSEEEYLVGYLPASVLVRGVKTAAKKHELAGLTQMTLSGYHGIFRDEPAKYRIANLLEVPAEEKQKIQAYYERGVGDVVRIDTIHAAKGMEFDNVLVVTDRPEHIDYNDEEHRILFTGVTRVKRHLGLSYIGRERYYYPIPF